MSDAGEAARFLTGSTELRSQGTAARYFSCFLTGSASADTDASEEAHVRLHVILLPSQSKGARLSSIKENAWAAGCANAHAHRI